MSLLNKLTVDLEEPKPKSDDPVAEALERALNNTTPSTPGTPWGHKPIEPFNDEEALKNDLFDKLLGK